MRAAFIVLSALAGLAATGAAGAAGNAPATSSLFASALAGEAGFDGQRGLTDNLDGTVAVGFRFSDRLSGELAGSRAESHRHVPGGAPVDADTSRVDALWHYFRSGRWQPYVSSGLGQQRFRTIGSEASETFGSFGIGVFRHVKGPFHFRADARAQYGFDEEALDVRVAAGVTVVFGGNYTGPVAAPVAP